MKPQSLTIYAETTSLALVTGCFVNQHLRKGVAITPPTPPAYRALWDTGATQTLVSERIVREQNLRETGEMLITAAAGSYRSPTFYVSLYLPNMFCFTPHRVAACMDNDKFDVLIGMDVISQGDFSITNRDNKTWFSFRMPSLRHIDYARWNQRQEHACTCGSGVRSGRCPCPINPKATKAG